MRVWWNGIHSRLKICRLNSLRVRIPPLAPNICLGSLMVERYFYMVDTGVQFSNEVPNVFLRLLTPIGSSA